MEHRYHVPSAERNTEAVEISPRVSLWQTKTSNLENVAGGHSDVKVAIMDDGKVRRLNCWDLDKTLLLAEGPHGETVELMFPHVPDKAYLRKTYFDGFKLGNSFREWDRMIRIFEEGQTQYEDPAVYKAEFIDNEEQRQLIDGKSEIHDRANDMLQRFGKTAAEWMEQKYKDKPEYFHAGEFLIKPMYQLLLAKQRLGEAHVFMTANQKDFARALIKYSGLAEHGLALATDETMAGDETIKGGGKEVAIPLLIKQLKEQYDLDVADDRIVAIGDSISGDVGSGYKVSLQDPKKHFSGLLVVTGEEELRKFQDQLTAEPYADPKQEQNRQEILRIVRDVDTTVIDHTRVPTRADGSYRLGKKTSQSKKPQTQG